MTRARYLEMAREAVKECATDCSCVGEYACCLHTAIAALLESECGKAYERGVESGAMSAIERMARALGELKEKARP
jgi:hypothetical protein